MAARDDVGGYDGRDDLPITGHAPLIYYNRDLFRKPGVPLLPAQHTWRWEDLLETAQRLTRRGATPRESQWDLLRQVHLPHQVGSMIWQKGGTLTDTRTNPTNPTRLTLDARAQEALQWSGSATTTTPGIADAGGRSDCRPGGTRRAQT